MAQQLGTKANGLPDPRVRYEELREEAIQETRLGRLAEAREKLLSAADIAAELGETFEERAFCNLAALDIEFGAPRAATITRLRAILTRNADSENCRLAAYHLARIYDLRKEFKKALFYARVAAERSHRSGREDWLASSHNQMGSLLLAESRFDEAQSELEPAYELQPSNDSVSKALVLDNLGYCLIVQGETRAGFRRLFEGLRILRRLDTTGWKHQIHLTLCFGYLEISRWRQAARHGLKALQMAEELGDVNASKNALFLLGETANLAGDASRAYSYFARLQEIYYPEHEFLPDFLLAVDVRGLVNLKA